MTSTRINRTGRPTSAVVVILFASILGGCGLSQPASNPVVVEAHGLQLGYTIEKLVEESEAIAVVHVNDTRDRVNNNANRLVNRAVDRVYHFSELEADDVLRGTVPGEVRQTGGTVGEFTYQTEGILLEPGNTYLLFLTDWLWRHEADYEPGAGITGGRAGIFTRQPGGTWANELGDSVTMSELRRLVNEVPNDPRAGAPLLPQELESSTDGSSEAPRATP
jgi:hypothetical protein